MDLPPMENRDSHLQEPAQFTGFWKTVLANRLVTPEPIAIEIAGPGPRISSRPLPPGAQTWLEFYMILLKKMPADELQEMSYDSIIKVEIPQAGGWRPLLLQYTWGEVTSNVLIELGHLLPSAQQAYQLRNFYERNTYQAAGCLDAEILKYLNNFITISRALK